jgi:hypothetical protein
MRVVHSTVGEQQQLPVKHVSNYALPFKEQQQQQQRVCLLDRMHVILLPRLPSHTTGVHGTCWEGCLAPPGPERDMLHLSTVRWTGLMLPHWLRTSADCMKL